MESGEEILARYARNAVAAALVVAAVWALAAPAMSMTATASDQALEAPATGRLLGTLSGAATVTLEGHGADRQGTDAVYELPGDGYCLDEGRSERMTADANPIEVPEREGFEFGGYWTEANGDGTCYIDESGYLTADADDRAFDAAGTLYARWYTTAKYMDADGRTACATQKVPINIPTEPLGIDDIPYSKKPPESCGWEFDCYADFAHYLDVSDYSSGYEDDYMETGCTEPGWDEVYVGYRKPNGIPMRYYADEGAKLLLTEETELDPEWRRTIHCTYYVDGLSTLTKEARFPQGYSLGQVTGATYEAEGYGKRTEKYWQRYTTTQFPPQHLYDKAVPSNGTMANGWLFMGWSCFKEGETPVSKSYLNSSSANRWPYVHLPSPGTSIFVTVTCWNTTAADQGNWWYGVYKRDVTVSIHPNGGSGSTVSSTLEQCITCGAPDSTKPYGFLGGSHTADNPFKRPGYSYLGLALGDPDSYVYDDDPQGAALYQFGSYIGVGNNSKSIGDMASWGQRAPVFDLYAEWKPKTVEIVLDKSVSTNLMTDNTEKIYHMADMGYYLESQCLTKMAADANPVAVGKPYNKFEFHGYFTEKYGKGECWIDENGYLTDAADPAAFPEGGTLYGAWTDTCACLDASGTLTFFRTFENTDRWVTSSGSGTVTDVAGNAYQGTVFWGVARMSMPFFRNKSILRAQVADGQHVAIENGNSLFYQCSNLAQTSGFDRIDVSRVSDMSWWFLGCESLEAAPDTSTWDTSNVNNMAEMFWGCKKMATAPDVSGWDTSKVKSLSCMFEWCEAMAETPDVSGWDTSQVTNMLAVFNNCEKIPVAPDVSRWNTSKVRTMKYLFSYMTTITSPPDVSGWDTSSCTDMSYMFYNEENIAVPPDVSGFDTSKVETFECMFLHNALLTAPPDVSGWDTSSLANAREMFYACWQLRSAPDVSRWDVSRLEDVICMFGWCPQMATAPDLSSWNTASLKEVADLFWHNTKMPTPKMFPWSYHPAGDDYINLIGTFDGCRAMTGKLDLSGWDISHVKNTLGLFGYCSKLDEIDISNIDVTGIEDVDIVTEETDAETGETTEVHEFGTMDATFGTCTSLKKVHLGPGFLFYNKADDKHGGCILPETESGYWLNASHGGSDVVTPEQLRDGYDGAGSDDSLNAGTYCAACRATFYNDEAPMGSQWLTWNTPRALRDVAGLSNAPAIDAANGWGFAGWATSNDTDDAVYSNREEATVATSIDLFCVYSRFVYFTHYKSASAIEPVTDALAQYWRSGEAQAVLTPLMTSSDPYGWRPWGWCRTDDPSYATSLPGGNLPVGDGYSLQHNLVIDDATNSRWFYGVYSRSCRVSYDRNDTKNRGGSTPDTTLAQYFTAGASLSTAPLGTLAENGFVKDDCEFVCWTLGSTDGPEYEEGAAIPADASLGNAQAWATEVPSYIMHAKWRALRITFEVPTRIELDVLADGTVIAPSPSATTIDNISPFDIDIVGYRVAPEDAGIPLVEHVGAANEVAVTLEPDGYSRLTLADYVNNAFGRAFWEISEGESLELDFEAEDVIKLDDLGTSPIKLASMYFKAQADI